MDGNQRRWIVVLAIGGIILVMVGTVLTYTWLTGRQTRDVAMPPQDASPEQVVTTYLNALNAHDCSTAAALYTPSSASDGHMWCADVQHLGHLRVDRAVNDPTSNAAYPLADVTVSFDLNWRPFHNDGSLPEGHTDWGYILTRTSAHSPWRISNQGVG